MMPLPADHLDPYTALIAAILRQAVLDARGATFAPGTQNPAQVQAEARQWLADEAGPRDLVELCGFDSAPVMQRIRRVLQAPVSVDAQPQLTLF